MEKQMECGQNQFLFFLLHPSKYLKAMQLFHKYPEDF